MAKKSSKKSIQNLQLRIGEVALFLRGLQLHRTDVGYLLMEYIDYMELKEKVEHPDKSLSSWIMQYNRNCLLYKQRKDDIVRFLFQRMPYSDTKPLDKLFGKGGWTAPKECITV